MLRDRLRTSRKSKERKNENKVDNQIIRLTHSKEIKNIKGKSKTIRNTLRVQVMKRIMTMKLRARMSVVRKEEADLEGRELLNLTQRWNLKKKRVMMKM